LLGVIPPLASSTPVAIAKLMQSFGSQSQQLFPKNLVTPVPAATQSAIERLTIADYPTTLFRLFSDSPLLQALNQFSGPVTLSLQPNAAKDLSVASRHHMVERTGILNPNVSWHSSLFEEVGPSVKIC
jgi:hypothetical protein